VENKRLEEIVELLWHTPGGWAELAAEDIKDLFAENERLRADVEHWRFEVPQTQAEARARAAESRLATAVKLLRELRARLDNHDVLVPRLDAFLASAQPAAPALHPMAGTELNQYDQPAAPARTEAEQAVLDAMRGWDERALRLYAKADESDHYGGTRGTPLEASIAPLCRAELARREAAK
jgi:hypothetical protein